MKMACSSITGAPFGCRLRSLYCAMRNAAIEGADFSSVSPRVCGPRLYGGVGVEAREEPGPCVGPGAVRGARRDAQRLGRLVEREAGEIAEFDELGRTGVGLCQHVERVVNGQEFFRRPLQREVGLIEGLSRLASAPFEAGLPPGALDED